jgi:hypothetical protein
MTAGLQGVCRLAHRHHHVRWSGALVLVCVLVPRVAAAHEIGTTRVVAAIAPDRSYAIAISSDASALLGRLELAQRRPITSAASAAEMQGAFDAVCDEVPRHLTVRFNDVESAPRATCVVDAADAAPDDPLNVLGVTVRLEGVAPAGATTLRWQYGLTAASYALVLKSSAVAETIWLDGNEESRPIALGALAAPPSRAELARTYLGLGFTHILPKGLDHILFVLGIFLLSRRLRPILWQVSAFTLAHSITLGLALYGVIELPSRIVEPLIAVSIVYVAIENLCTSELKPWRVTLVFAFGLLHGMGFAGVLRELALPNSELLTGLVAFNVGVEAGQLTVILGAFLCVGVWTRRSEAYRRFVVVPASIAIAATGAFWAVQRLS